jgi:hypothetical protein
LLLATDIRLLATRAVSAGGADMPVPAALAYEQAMASLVVAPATRTKAAPPCSKNAK